MADLSHLKIDVTTEQTDNRKGESPLTAFGKYNDLVTLLEQGGTGSPSAGSSTAFSEITAGDTTTLLVSKNVFKVTLTKANCLITLAPLPDFEGAVIECQLMLKQGTGSNVVTWPLAVRWPTGIAPKLSFEEDMLDVISLISVDGGSSWIGSYIGGWYDDA